MNPAVLAYKGEIPQGIDAELWLRYLKGSRAFDELWGLGRRCPSNGEGTRCRCDVPRQDYCKYWRGIEAIARQVGGSTADLITEME